jgi:hypothetical protein
VQVKVQVAMEVAMQQVMVQQAPPMFPQPIQHQVGNINFPFPRIPFHMPTFLNGYHNVVMLIWLVQFMLHEPVQYNNVGIL